MAGQQLSRPVYLHGGYRTPFAGLMGGLKEASAPQLAASTIKQLITQMQIDSKQIEACYLGQVLQGGVGQSPARQAALGAGLSESTNVSTINKVCGSGLEAIIQMALGIGQGRWEVGIAGGMESMSQAPFMLPQMRGGIKYGASTMIDSIERDGLSDAYGQQSMGACAEICNQKLGISRKEQDDYAILSYQRAIEAEKQGIFKAQKAPVILSNGKLLECNEDENLGKVKFDKIPNLRPAFTKEASGTITAANASSINDGAATVLMSCQQKMGNTAGPVFRIKSFAGFSQHPTWFVTAPIGAMQKALALASLDFSAIDLFEINEAFALVVLGCVKELKLDMGKVNIHGGAISLGHPIGASGARIVVSLMKSMELKGSKLGMASICIGGGEGLALIIERVL
jgi:acetyl-CoA C-acetyltransferase